MKIFLIVSLLFFIFGLGLMLLELPVVTGTGLKKFAEELEQTRFIELSGKTLFISDLQLQYNIPLKNQFHADFSDANNVIIVGDFFHSPRDFSMFGETEEKALKNVLSEIVPEKFSGKIFFLSGRNHDPELTVSSFLFDTFELVFLGEYAKFLVERVPAVAFHGHQLYGGIIGGGVSWLVQKIGYPLLLERLAKKQLGIPNDLWLITGHSHVPGIHPESKTANTGSFAGVPFNWLFRVPAGTGLLFEKGDISLIQFVPLP